MFKKVVSFCLSAAVAMSLGVVAGAEMPKYNGEGCETLCRETRQEEYDLRKEIENLKEERKEIGDVNRYYKKANETLTEFLGGHDFGYPDWSGDKMKKMLNFFAQYLKDKDEKKIKVIEEMITFLESKIPLLWQQYHEMCPNSECGGLRKLGKEEIKVTCNGCSRLPEVNFWAYERDIAAA